MGWQDAPVVDSAAPTGGAQPAWMSAPEVPESLASKVGDVAKNVEGAVVEPALQMATGTVGAAAGGLRGLADLVTGQGGHKAAADIASTEQALTYQPRTTGGKAVSAAINYPLEKYGELAHKAGEEVTKKTGSGVAGGLVDSAIEIAPALLTRRPTAAANTAAEDAAALARAKSYVTTNTSLDWSRLSQGVKDTLTKIAHDAKRLTNLDPKAVERQARLEKLGLPATRGQVTRDLSQLTREENITKSDAGADIRNINAEQDRILHQQLDTLRGQTGAKATTPGQVGASVQGAARSKLNALRADYRAAYQQAEDSGALQAPVDLAPLRKWMANPTNRLYSGNIAKLIKNYAGRGERGKFIPKGQISINDLEEIRKAVTKESNQAGAAGHYAKEARGVIDDILDKSGSDVYKAARAKFKAVQDEFDRQGRVAGLVKNKGYTTDRAVALEDTFDNVVRKGSNEQLQTVRETLKDTPKGQQAWRDLQGATIDYLKSAAAGKRAIPGEQGQLQFNSAFIDAVHDLDADGKLDTLFGPGTSARIREIEQATRDVRTKPTGRIAGSDTTARVLGTLEKLSQVPIIGEKLAGVGRALTKIGDIGKETREAARAKTTPLEEGASKADKAAKHRQTLRSVKQEAAPAATLTLENQNQ